MPDFQAGFWSELSFIRETCSPINIFPYNFLPFMHSIYPINMDLKASIAWCHTSVCGLHGTPYVMKEPRNLVLPCITMTSCIVRLKLLQG